MFVPISSYLEIARVSQYLAANDIADQSFLKGGSVNANLARLLYIVRKPIQWLFENDPTNESLNAPTIYLYGLCGRYVAQAEQIIANQSQTAPSLTNPTNQTVNDGDLASFSTVVTSSIPYTVQWYKNSVLIPGATSTTYSFTATTDDDGDQYSVTATNAAGSVSSSPATLTVTQNIVAYYYYGNTDYSTQLQANTDNVPYIGTFPVTAGQPLSYTWPSGAANNQYIVVKYPATESIKTTYTNAPVNNGVIPSIAFASIVTFGGWNYIFSRTDNPFSQNTNAPLIFS